MKKIVLIICMGLTLFTVPVQAAPTLILFEDFEDSSGFTVGGGYAHYCGVAPLNGTQSIPSYFVQGGSQYGNIFYGSFAKEYIGSPAATMTISLPDLTGYTNLQLTVALAAPDGIWENSHRDSLHIIGGTAISPPYVDCAIAAGCLPVTGAIDSFIPTAFRRGNLRSQVHSIDLQHEFQDFTYSIDISLKSLTFAFASTDYPEVIGIDSVRITGDPRAPVPITVNPYSDEYVIMVGSGVDWSTGNLFYIPINPDGTFGNVSFVADLGYRSGAGIADFDNDGDLDFVAGARDDTRPVANFYLFENIGNGKFIQHLIASNVDTGGPSDNKVGTFAVADFNGDGFKDFVAPIYRSNYVYLFTNNGDKTFTRTLLSQLSNPSDAKEGDFNEDGHMDFVITQYFDRKVYLYKNDGNGNFEVQFLFDISDVYPGDFRDARVGDITVGDFDEDGHLDIIVDDCDLSAIGGAYLYVGDGTGSFVYRSQVYSRPQIGAYIYGVDSFDFDKDGHMDLILSSYDEGPVSGLVFIKKGNGDGTFQDAVQISTDPFAYLGSVFPVTPSEIPEDVTAPILSLPNDITVECTGPQGKVVIFDATAIDNIDGPVQVTCTPDSGGTFLLGITTVTCSASDKAGNMATGTFNIIVNDSTIPNITNLTASPDILWPPNHKMVPVSLVAQASDTCDPNPICKIVSISSNEPENGLGDGDTSPDWEITGKLKVNLRAERSGNGSGRVYTITVMCSDTSGNSSSGTAMVTVPHDQGEKKK